MQRTRADELVDLSVRELVTMVMRLEGDVARLERALGGAMCGHVLGTTSCQLPRGHSSLHAWSDATSDLVIRW